MDKQLKTKWVKALRSGKYRQGRVYLRIAATHGGHPKHCCLGVLCDVMGKDMKDIATNNRQMLSEVVDAGKVLGRDRFPAMAGLRNYTENDKFDAEGLLAEMNDSGFKFREIADWIEENL